MPVEQDITLQGKRKARGNLGGLKQWGAKQPHPTKADLDTLHGHDPKKVLFMSFDRNDKSDFSDPSRVPYFEESSVEAISGYMASIGYGQRPTTYNLNSAKEGTHDPGAIYRTIAEHVKKYGPLTELMISGHGKPNEIGNTASFLTRGFLLKLAELQEELGFKIADRIVFNGCRVFADLDDAHVRSYKGLAKRLGAEIVGATSDVVYDSGRFVQFTVEGTVKRDRRDSPVAAWSIPKLDPKLPPLQGPQDEAWFEKELHAQRKAATKLAAPTHAFNP